VIQAGGQVEATLVSSGVIFDGFAAADVSGAADTLMGSIGVTGAIDAGGTPSPSQTFGEPDA
jgi:hypothetical protein